MKAWDEVKTVRRQVDKHVHGYHRARNAMVRLGADDELLEKYLVIEWNNLGLSRDITDEKCLGQRNDKLAWFWSVGRDPNADNAWMTECTRLPIFLICFCFIDNIWPSLSCQLVESQGTSGQVG